jgi:CheY-like chemotaxis protein
MNTSPILASHRPSLLVVEDDAVLNQLLVRQLQKAGYDVVSALSWAEARTALQRVAPDLVLLDVNLPDSKGFGPLSEISQQPDPSSCSRRLVASIRQYRPCSMGRRTIWSNR